MPAPTADEPTGPAVVTGSGDPVTLAAHGLGASIAETRPLLSGVTGRRVFYPARGHDGRPTPPFTYRDLGNDLLAVADAHRATRAVGVSMGSGALLSVLADRPDRFQRVVLLLPAALDRPRTDIAVRRLERLADAIDTADVAAIRQHVRDEVPADLTGAAVEAYVTARASFLVDNPGVATALRSLPGVLPVPDRAALGAVGADVLVLAQEGDPLHPAQVGRDVAAALPRARLVVFDQPGFVFRERGRLRRLIADFLTG